MKSEHKTILHNIRSIFISDVHLGTAFCEHEKLFNFLKSLEDAQGHYPKTLEYVYLVGDIIDLTNCNITLLFNKHRNILKKIFRLSDKGVTVIFIPGNHDYYFRHEHNSLLFQDKFKIVNKIIHTTVSGNKWLLTHGDQFDTAIQLIPFAYTIGDFALNFGYCLSKWISWIRKRLHYKTDFSLVYFLKSRIKNIIQYISSYSALLIKEAEEVGAYGIICGHIHRAELKSIKGKNRDIVYANCGCWTEPGQETFLVETLMGDIELHNYNEWIFKK